MQALLSSIPFQLTIKRLALQLLENDNSLDNVVFVGIQPRGIRIADKIIEVIKEHYQTGPVHYGWLDITFYRDDIREELHVPRNTTLTQSIEGKKVILIDDVLYTGRTIRAALDALQDFGRPRKVELCVLVNRRFNRELPIQPDFTGISIDTRHDEKVRVDVEKSEVLIFN